MRRPRAVVIGYGFAGRCFHSYLINSTPELKLQGVASRSADTRKRIKTELGCLAYESFEQVIEDPDVDLVVLATPNSTHAELAVQALQAGKHVVTDKVMALSLEECDRMIQAAGETGKLLSVFQNRRWDGDYLTLKKLMEDGMLGDVRWIEMAWQGFGAWGGWRGRAEMGGGKLYDLGAHLIDQLCLLFPYGIKSVYCRMHHDLPQTDTESQSLVVIEFDNGATGVCDTSSLAAITKPRIHAFGSGGTFVKYGVDPQEAAMIAGDIDSAKEDPRLFGRLHDGKTETIIPTMPGRWRNYYENIAETLTKNAKPMVKLPEVRRAIAVIDAAFQSARTGEVVHLNIPSLDEAKEIVA